jgi:hypothetical protein
MNDHHLLVQFAKDPVKGKVKTRLARTMGEEKALAVHTELMQAVNAKLTAYKAAYKRCKVLGAFSLDAETTASNEHLEALVLQYALNFDAIQVQQGSGLGCRMLAVLSEGLTHAQKVIIVGSDFPTIDTAYLAAAFESLDRADMVLGASEDGGYGLIGARQLNALDFSTIAWGTEQVLQQTLSACSQASLTAEVLAPRYDIDYEADYVRWKSSQM